MSDSFTQNQPVMLGNLILFGFETPSRIKYSLKQSISVHRLAGGGRVFDANGGDPGPISWSGIFLGLGRYEKQQALEMMRQAAKIVTLRWGKWSLPVMIQDVNYEEGFQRIDYNITVLLMTVVQSQEDQQNDTGEADAGTGEQPTDSTAASDSGRQVTGNAAAVAPRALPIPPIPPGIPAPPPAQPAGGIG